MHRFLQLFLLVSVFTISFLIHAQEPSSSDALMRIVSLPKPVHFSGVQGDDTLVPSGIYWVTPQQDSLRLVNLESGESFIILAAPGAHDQELFDVLATSTGGVEEEPDVHVVTFMYPTGAQQVAEGTYSGITPRGWKERLAEEKRKSAVRRAKRQRLARLAREKAAEIAQNAAEKAKEIALALASRILSLSELTTRGFENDPGDESNPESYILVDGPDVYGVGDHMVLSVNSNDRVLLANQTFRLDACSAPIESRTNATLFGKCRIWVQPPTYERVKLRPAVVGAHGYANQSFEWISKNFQIQETNTATISMELGVSGKLQAYGIGSRAGMTIIAVLENCRQPCDDIAGSWAATETPLKWSVEAVAQQEGVGIDAGALSFGVEGVLAFPKQVREDPIFVLQGVTLLPQYRYRVRTKVSYDVVTGLRVLRPLGIPLLPPGILFPTSANFDRKIGGAADRGIQLRKIWLTTNPIN